MDRVSKANYTYTTHTVTEMNLSHENYLHFDD